MIVNDILDRLTSHLSEKMITLLDPDDEDIAVVVKKGLLQLDKVQNNISIGVLAGDHDDPDYKDGIVTLEELKNIGFNVDPREVGGGQVWWRRGIITIECFFIEDGFEESKAFDVAYNVLGRVQANIENLDVSGVEDEYGELAVKMFCYANTFFESGGPPSDYIFRGKVFWQCLTERP